MLLTEDETVFGVAERSPRVVREYVKSASLI
jgi:hypothetical protein